MKTVMKGPMNHTQNDLQNKSNTSRRTFVRNSLALAAGAAATTSLPGCGIKFGDEPQSPISFEPGKPLPWINWAGNQSCMPSSRVAPTSDEEIVDALKNAAGVVRTVGSSHSFSPVVPTDDTLLTTDLLSGLVSHNPELMQAEVWAGTRIHDLGPLLASVGQALPNQPDMDYPSIGGSIANSVHATGEGFGSMSSYVAGLTLISPAGEILDCNEKQNPEIFQAAKTSVGALGVISRIKLQNQKAFDLTEHGRIENTEEVLEDLDSRFANHRHFELLPLPHTPLTMTVTTDLAAEGDTNQGEDDPHVLNELRRAFDAVSWVPGFGASLYGKLINREIAKQEGLATVRTGPSFKVFPHIRTIRFREMEYTVPVEAGPACLREILDTIKKRNLPMCFPLEYRHVKGDDIWLSMYEGQAGAAISVHQFGDLDYKAVFAEIEPIFWKYAGRPHWGKLHTLSAKQLSALYPRHWQDFQEVRRELDPEGKMLNEHLRSVFGV
jgi:FAD-linked oxidoreductase